MTPENVATSRPFLRSNSLIEARFCSSDISCSFDSAGGASEDDAEQADTDADEDSDPGARTQDFAGELPAKDGRHEGAERCGVAKCDGHAQRHAEIAHGKAEGQSAEAPQHAEGIGPRGAERGASRRTPSKVAASSTRRKARAR